MSLSPSLTREDLAALYGVSQGYLGYLLRERKVPLPIRINGEALWYSDEVEQSLPRIRSLLAHKNKSH